MATSWLGQASSGEQQSRGLVFPARPVLLGIQTPQCVAFTHDNSLGLERPFQGAAHRPSLLGRPEGMKLVEFLESRIAERESAVLITPAPPSLVKALLAECAQERQILAAWRQAAEEEGITDPEQAAGTMAVACSLMLSILAAGYEGRPEQMQRRVPAARPGTASTDEGAQRRP